MATYQRSDLAFPVGAFDLFSASEAGVSQSSLLRDNATTLTSTLLGGGTTIDLNLNDGTLLRMTGTWTVSGFTISGTLTGVVRMTGGNPLETISDFSVPFSATLDTLTPANSVFRFPPITQTIGGNDTVNGGARNDYIKGFEGEDLLQGFGGDDRLDGGLGNDQLDGGTGNDTFVLGNENDSVADTGGTDTITSTITRSLAGFATVEHLTLLGVGNINGTGNALANVITGNDGINTLVGLGGNDRLIGLNSNDTLDGGVGLDRLEGGAGNDTYIIDSASEVLVELSGVDLVRSTVTKTLATGFENLTLLTGNINGTGNTVANIITGSAGTNTLLGAAGNDRLIGLGGNDTLDGGVGIDRLEGGAGNDTYTIDNPSDVLVEVSGIDLVRSTVTKTLATGFENLTLLGTVGLSGSGNAAANILTGNTGANTLSGLAGNDTMVGGAGNDSLVGGIGKDTMTGGAGADKFDFNLMTESVRGVNRDVILDFVRAQGDKIDLSTIDADIDGTVGNQAFAFIGAGAFTGADGQLRCSGGIVQGDTNGDKIADLEIKVNLATLVIGDFVL